MSKSLRQIQNEHAAWATKNFSPGRSDPDRFPGPPGQPQLFHLAPFLGIVEEVGELSHAILKYQQGIRGFDWEKYETARDDAVSDILIFLLDFCSVEGIDLQSKLEQTWEKVSKRDWSKPNLDNVDIDLLGN